MRNLLHRRPAPVDLQAAAVAAARSGLPAGRVAWLRQTVRLGGGSRGGASRCRPRGVAGRVRGVSRPVGVGQDDVAEPHRRDRRGDHRQRRPSPAPMSRQLDGKELTAYRRDRVGFVFQFFNLVPTLDGAGERAAAGGGDRRATPRRAAGRRLPRVGLAEVVDRFPAQLSGGQQQRVAIARALVKEPPLLLCDEPTGSLDLDTGRQVLAVLRDLAREGHHTVLLVTHNSAIARMADRVVRLHSGRDRERRTRRASGRGRRSSSGEPASCAASCAATCGASATQFAAVVVVIAIGRRRVRRRAPTRTATSKDSFDRAYTTQRLPDVVLTGPSAHALAAEAARLPGEPFVTMRVADRHRRPHRQPHAARPGVERPRRRQPDVVAARRPLRVSSRATAKSRRTAPRRPLRPPVPAARIELFGPAGWRTVRVSGTGLSTEYFWPARSQQEVMTSAEQFGVVFAPESLVASLTATPETSTVAVHARDRSQARALVAAATTLAARPRSGRRPAARISPRSSRSTRTSQTFGSSPTCYRFCSSSRRCSARSSCCRGSCTRSAR